jgi:hypothetical protein
MKSIMQLLVIFLLLSSCRHEDKKQASPTGKLTTLTVPTDSNSLYFPLKGNPSGAIDQEQTLESFADIRYSHVLFVLHEPGLWNYSGPKEIYRFTYIPSFVNAPVTITILQDSLDHRMTYRTRLHIERVRPDGSFENTGHDDSIVVDTTFAVKPEEWKNFQSCLDKADFWRLPGTTDDTTVEGTQYLLEGTKNGKYHFAIRWSASDDRFPDYYECCDYLLQIARKSVRRGIIM